MNELNRTTAQETTEQGGAQTAEGQKLPAGDPKSTPAEQQDAKPETKTFSQEELNRIVSERLKAEQKKWEKKLADDKAEAERVAEMSADEKARHEREKREHEFEEREAALLKRERLAIAKDKLAEKNVPLALIAAVDISADDTIDGSAEAVAKAFSDAVSAEVAKRLASEPPKKGTQNNSLSDTVKGIFGNK